MIIRAFILLLIAASLGCKSDGKNTVDKFKERVDKYANDIIDKGNTNSLAIAIYKDGMTYENYYGELDNNMGNTPNDSTLYEIASISKVFTGSLVAKAVTEGKIALNDDIRLYLNEEYSNLEFKGEPVRIKNLVTHTLGFSTPDGLSNVYDKIFNAHNSDITADYNIDDLLIELQSVTLDTTPGVKYEYNNVGPELAAYILEQIYGQSYRSLLNSFLNDLEITGLHLADFAKHKNYLANGHGRDGQIVVPVNNPLLGGAGGLIASLPAMSKFMKFQLESKAPLIKESTSYVLKNGEDDTGYYWDLGKGSKEGFYYLKSGSSNGTESVILICPDSNYGMVIIMNNQSEAAIEDFANLYNRIENGLIEL